MSFKYPICERTFGQRTVYSQHVQKCLKKTEGKDDDDDVEMDTEGDQDSNFEKDNIEVIMLF